MAAKKERKKVAKKKTVKTTPVVEEVAGEQIVNADIGSHLPDNHAGGIPNPQVVGNE